MAKVGTPHKAYSSVAVPEVTIAILAFLIRVSPNSEFLIENVFFSYY